MQGTQRSAPRNSAVAVRAYALLPSAALLSVPGGGEAATLDATSSSSSSSEHPSQSAAAASAARRDGLVPIAAVRLAPALVAALQRYPHLASLTLQSPADRGGSGASNGTNRSSSGSTSSSSSGSGRQSGNGSEHRGSDDSECDLGLATLRFGVDPSASAAAGHAMKRGPEGSTPMAAQHDGLKRRKSSARMESTRRDKRSKHTADGDLFGSDSDADEAGDGKGDGMHDAGHDQSDDDDASSGATAISGTSEEYEGDDETIALESRTIRRHAIDGHVDVYCHRSADGGGADGQLHLLGRLTEKFIVQRHANDAPANRRSDAEPSRKRISALISRINELPLAPRPSHLIAAALPSPPPPPPPASESATPSSQAGPQSATRAKKKPLSAPSAPALLSSTSSSSFSSSSTLGASPPSSCSSSSSSSSLPPFATATANREQLEAAHAAFAVDAARFESLRAALVAQRTTFERLQNAWQCAVAASGSSVASGSASGIVSGSGTPSGLNGSADSVRAEIARHYADEHADIESKLLECNALHARLTALKRQIADFAPAAASVRSPTLKAKAGKSAE